MTHIFEKYYRDNGGNFAIMFAVILSILAFAMAVAMDSTHAMSTKSKLAGAADVTALAAAIAAADNPDEREEIALQALYANLGAQMNLDGVTPTIVFDDTTSLVSVSLAVTRPTFFGGLLGRNELDISAVSEASYQIEEIDPISISFALDVSGSMGEITANGQPKIEVLKTATASLFDAIVEGSERPDLLDGKVRTGMNTYNTDVVDTIQMADGWDSLLYEVNALAADGGTNSTPALQAGYDQLINDSAQPENLRRYIIFMTDGMNNDPDENDNSSALCQQIKLANIEVFSVAFDAEETGQLLLLDCASSDTDTPQAETGGGANGGGGGIDLSCLFDTLFSSSSLKQWLGGCINVEEMKAEKVNHYFEAGNPDAFIEAFKKIGDEIGKTQVRITR